MKLDFEIARRMKNNAVIPNHQGSLKKCCMIAQVPSL